MFQGSGILRGDEFVSSEMLSERSKRAASALSSAGVGAGDTVALLLRNDIPFFEAVFAASTIGATPVPQNWHGNPDEVLGVLLDCKAKVLVAHADLLHPMLGRLPEGLHVRVVPTPRDIGDAYGVAEEDWATPQGMVEWQGWIEGFEVWSEPPVAPQAAMLYTSGTTGSPKGVRRAALSAEARERSVFYGNLDGFFGVVPGVRAVVTGPMYHSAPFYWGIGWMREGGFVVLQPRFDAEALLRLIEEEKITNLYLAPIMCIRLLKLPDEVRRRYDVSSIRHVTNGAAPCPPGVKQAMIDWWGPVVYEMYGSLEIGSPVGSTSEEWLAHPGTVGKALPGAEIKILDADGNELPAGEAGEVYARIADQPSFVYEGQSEGTRVEGRDGFLTAGDIGYLDADGFLYISDRKKDMVISGGVNIYPPEIEDCLLAMPGVRDVGVFGIPDEEYGESVAAAVELDGTAEVTAEDVRAFVRTHLAGYKVPKVVEFRSIPRLDSGKILKRELREPYWSAVGRVI